VNLLLTQLLAKGMIGQKDTSVSQPPATETSSASAVQDAATTDESDVSVHFSFCHSCCTCTYRLHENIFCPHHRICRL